MDKENTEASEPQGEKANSAISQSEEFFNKGRDRAGKRLGAEYGLKTCVMDCWKLIDELNGKTGRNFMDFSAFELTERAGRLSLLKSYIGNESSKAHCKTNNAYIYKKFQEAWTRKPATKHLEEEAKIIKGSGKAFKVLSKDIDAEVVRRTIQLEQDWAFNQEYSDILKNLFDSIHWILTAIGWRVKELNADKYTTNFQDQADTSQIKHPLDPK